MSACLSLIYDMISELASFTLPWGLTFGAVVVGVLGLPYLVRAIKSIF